MLRNIIGKTGWLSAVLCFILMVTTVLPFGVGVVYANGGLNFIGIPNNTSATNPHIHYSPEITIKGTYPTDVNGEDLRYEVTSLSGSQPTDTSSIRPAIDAATRTFTFRNIELMPGVNKISFSYRGDDSNTDLSSVYVQYNNTPLFSELRIDSVNLDSDPTVVEVNSTRNLTLDLSGIAVNATSVRATNKTTGETFSDDTNSSGRFSIELEALIGLNEIDIHAYSQNREVGLVNRSILVVPSGNAEGGSDQFYNVEIGGTPLTKVPPAKTELHESELASKPEITGELMIKVPTGATILDSDDPDDTSAPEAPVGVSAVSDGTTTTVTGTAEAGTTIQVFNGTRKLNPTEPPIQKADGSFTIKVAAQPIGEDLTVTATDAADNESEEAPVTVTEANDTEAPNAPASVALISNTKLSGTAEAGSVVIVKVGSLELGRGNAASNQLFEVTIPEQEPGTTLSVTATDAAGNISDATPFTIPGTPDTEGPAAPDVDPVTSTATKVTGIAEAGTIVTVTNASGQIGSGTAGVDGKFEVAISPQPPGTPLNVTATDISGNPSNPPATVTVTVAPIEPPTPAAPPKPTVDQTVIKNSTRSITGSTVALATITVKRGSTVLGTDEADGEGNFEVSISAPAVGDKLSVTATKDGQVSEGEVVTVEGQNSLNLTLKKLDTSDEITLSNVKFTPVTDHMLSSEYKLYSVEADVNLTDADWAHDDTYELQVTYQLQRQDPDNLSSIINDVTVENYSYQIVYKKGDQPRFGDVTDISKTGVELPIKTDGSVNIVNTLPVKLEIEAFNMNSSTFDVYYNNTKKVAGTDYVFAKSGNTITIEFINLPTSETTIRVEYPYDHDGLPATENVTEEISFKLKPEVVPSLLFYYTVSEQTKVIDSTLEITDSNVSNFGTSTFTGQLYNYKIDPTKSNMVITLNGDDKQPIQYNRISESMFTIPRIQFTKDKAGKEWNFNQGTNTLVFTLTDDPSVKFTYTIIYNTSKTPKIKDVTLKVIQGKNDEEELKRTSTDSAYQTSAYFLSELSFAVENVEIVGNKKPTVSVKKDGKVIAKYELQSSSGDWKFLKSDSEYTKTRDEAIKDNTRGLGNIFDATTFSKTEDIRSKFSFSAEMDADEYGEELVGELNDMGLSGDELDDRLKRFPLTLAKGGTTNYQIEVTQGSIITRHNISIGQDTQAWTVISPTKSDNAEYITVNSNSVPIKIFAENATKVTFGKEEAVAYNTTEPDYEYDPDTGKLIPETYYVFEKNVTLKKGLNTIKFTVAFGENEYDDEIKIYNVNSSVGGAEYREILGKKTSFSVFDKSFELKFPTGTVLLAPAGERAGNEVHQPDRDIFTDVTLYFGIADRTNGRVSLDDNRLRDEMEDLMTSEIDTRDFNYASPLYYVDAGNAPPAGEDDDDEERAPGGRDPYYDGTINDIVMEPFIERWEYNLVPSKEGTVTIKYDSSIVNAANTVLTVFYNNGDEWTNIGGVVNTSKQTITVPFAGFGYYMVMMTRETFSDVITHPFARDAIETLYAKGIMVDAPGSGFGTELNIRRGEFATMLVKALDLPINAGPYDSSGDPTAATFRDVHPDLDEWDYEYEYIETAARAGIVRGKDISSFEPDSWLTREEAAIMISRALNLKTGAVEAAQTQLGKMFTDAQLTGYYAAPSVLAVAKAKIMNGEPNDETAKKPTYRFNPRGELTRAEMAVITVRIMQQLKKLPKQ